MQIFLPLTHCHAFLYILKQLHLLQSERYLKFFGRSLVRDLSIGPAHIFSSMNEVRRKEEVRDIFPEKTDKIMRLN